MSERERRPTQIQFETAPELEGGTYANAFGVWYTPYEFTLDFAVAQQPEIVDPDDPGSPVLLRCLVTSRVKLPVTMVFDVIRGLNAAMTQYEEQFGEIRRPWEDR